MDINTFDYEIIPPQYRKVANDEWINLSTNERIKIKKKMGILVRSEDSLSKTFNRLRKTIRHNFYGHQSEVFVTLTFDRLIEDTKELSIEFDKFWDKLHNDCNISNSYSPPYRALVVVEPTDKHKYHLHVLLKRLDDGKLFIPYQKLNKLWTNGNAHIETLYDAEGLGKYLDSCWVKKKRERLHLYGCNLQIYRRRGEFEKLKKSVEPHGEALKRAKEKGFTFQHSHTFNIIKPMRKPEPEPDYDEVRINTITAEYYSVAKRRPKHHKYIDTYLEERIYE